jgi:hypothetical protein
MEMYACEPFNSLVICWFQQVIYKKIVTSSTFLFKNIETPHPVFNGVGDIDGIWIPTHIRSKIQNKQV